MEILSHKDYKELLGYLPTLKKSLKDWLFVDIRITDTSDQDLTVDAAANAVQALFRNKEGKLYVCNSREILMIVRWGKTNPPTIVADTVSKALPEKGCAVYVHEPTLTGIAKLEILITYKKPSAAPTFADIRATRRENVVIVADDDMYLRMLVKKGVGGNYTVVEIANGNEVFEAYKKYAPDIIFLDIHMPNLDGTAILQHILALDPSAYIIMLSADSSRENVELTVQKGARGFLTKPFSKERLQECLNKCPTIF